MAGDWIKLEHATVDKPEVLTMAEILETSADDVLGKLFRVWIWFDQQSVNGDAGGVTGVTLMKFIDRLVASQGFAACMKKVGWLTDNGIPNFDNHNGESAKNRALTRKRMKRMRDGDGVTKSSPEKRREEKKETTSTAVALPPWVPEEAWSGYVEMRKKIRHPLTDRAKALELKTLERLKTEGHDPRAVLDKATAASWRGLFAPKDSPKVDLGHYR